MSIADSPGGAGARSAEKSLNKIRLGSLKESGHAGDCLD